jgi:SpoVK/Ycf46/Vps4 family AAA+-type ATPase
MHDFWLKLAMAALTNRPKPIQKYLTRHFRRDPRKNAIVKLEFNNYRHGCATRALQRCLKDDGNNGAILGTMSTEGTSELVDFLHPDAFDGQTVGPVQYHDVELKSGKHLSCPRNAFYLMRHLGKKIAVYLRVTYHRYSPELIIEIMAADKKVANDFAQKLKGLMDELSIYRGAVLAIKKDEHDDIKVEFKKVAQIDSADLILPAHVREEILRNTVGFSKHKEKLLAQKRHLKRGLLLYGPPGTGKSLTVMHLISAMPGRTTVLLTGSTIDWMADACKLARALAPATIVIDDVDLIAAERSTNKSNSLLFELLNQMDGIADDADILFLLTTNNPAVLEPAIAARPGRVDQAIEVPLPDADCRRMLFELYAKGLPLAMDNFDYFIANTENASAAFIRELFRKAAVFAVEESHETTASVTDAHMSRALELLTKTNPLTKKLLGFDSEESREESKEEQAPQLIKN